METKPEHNGKWVKKKQEKGKWTSWYQKITAGPRALPIRSENEKVKIKSGEIFFVQPLPVRPGRYQKVTWWLVQVLCLMGKRRES
jgi:hypothetical protein